MARTPRNSPVTGVMNIAWRQWAKRRCTTPHLIEMIMRFSPPLPAEEKE